MKLLIALLILVVAVVLLRAWLLRRQTPAPAAEPFDGVLYRVGNAYVAERRPPEPRATVLAMHGFCESPRYFTAHYADPDLQLILIASCDYHPALDAPVRAAAWAQAPAAAEGSIEYDAAVLVQALEQLPATRQVRVHGHSRGGAVVLEAAATRPDLFRGVEVVLEAPVLPQGQPWRRISPIMLWFLPLQTLLWRRWPLAPALAFLWGSLGSPRKRELIAALPFNARRAATMVANLRSLGTWMHEHDTDLYRHLERGVVLVPDADRILDAGAMARSAAAAGERLRVANVASSHFVLLDRPDLVPPLTTAAVAAPDTSKS